MAHFRYECFCTMTYDSELTYEEVLERETELQARMQATLEDSGARHIDFVPINDSLQAQCAFAELEPDESRLLCADIAELAVAGVRGRLMLVNKELDDVTIVLFAGGRPLLTRLAFPVPDESMTEARFTSETLASLSSREREEIRERRLPPAPPEPAPPLRPAFDKRGLAGPGGGWPDARVNPALLVGQDPAGAAASPDPRALLDAWREQMRRRIS